MINKLKIEAYHNPLIHTKEYKDKMGSIIDHLESALSVFEQLNIDHTAEMEITEKNRILYFKDKLRNLLFDLNRDSVFREKTKTKIQY